MEGRQRRGINPPAPQRRAALTPLPRGPELPSGHAVVRAADPRGVRGVLAGVDAHLPVVGGVKDEAAEEHPLVPAHVAHRGDVPEGFLHGLRSI